MKHDTKKKTAYSAIYVRGEGSNQTLWWANFGTDDLNTLYVNKKLGLKVHFECTESLSV